MKPLNTFSLKRTDMGHIKVGSEPANQSEDDPWPMLSGHLHKMSNNEDKLSCHLARRCLCPTGFLSATVLIFFPSFTRLLKIIAATYTLIVTCIGSPYKSMNSVHKARSGFSAGQSSSFTPHTLIHVLVDPALCIDLVV
ncbi:unnamed protein product [Oreochromis niloticus]|nr:unnamed protein product [Mustela putorius furo]